METAEAEEADGESAELNVMEISEMVGAGTGDDDPTHPVADTTSLHSHAGPLLVNVSDVALDAEAELPGLVFAVTVTVMVVVFGARVMLRSRVMTEQISPMSEVKASGAGVGMYIRDVGDEVEVVVMVTCWWVVGREARMSAREKMLVALRECIVLCEIVSDQMTAWRVDNYSFSGVSGSRGMDLVEVFLSWSRGGILFLK